MPVPTPEFDPDFFAQLQACSDPPAPPAPLPVESYQLIRGVLAAWHSQRRFAVVCDSRRADLVEKWFRILRAVRTSELRSRLALVTWQEIAAAVPDEIQCFLAAKYGILA